MRFLIQLPNRFSYKGLKKLMKVNDLSYPIDTRGTQIKDCLIIDTDNLRTFTRVLLEISNLFRESFITEEVYEDNVFAQYNDIDFNIIPVVNILDSYGV